MSKRAERAYLSVWRHRGLSLLAGVAAALVVGVVLGVVSASPASACTVGGPVNSTLPVIEGLGVAGGTLTTTNGTWTATCGHPAPSSFSYAWYRDGTTSIATV